MKLFMVKMIQGRGITRPLCSRHPIAADNAVQAAEFLIARFVEIGKMPNDCQNLRILVCEHVWDGKPGFKEAVNSNGDIRYDIRCGPDGFFPVYSERSFA